MPGCGVGAGVGVGALSGVAVGAGLAVGAAVGAGVGVGAAGSGAVKPAAIAPMPRLAHKSAAMPPAISLCSGRRETALPEKYFIGFFLAMLLIPLLFLTGAANAAKILSV